MVRCLPLFSLLLLTSLAPAATMDEIIARSGKVLDGINDFVCVMTFNVRSADMRVPDSRVRIYFKKPDRFKPEAIDGDFAVLPETYHLAIGNVLQRLVEGHKPFLAREQAIAGRTHYAVKLVPREADAPVNYHWVYVDKERYTVSRLASYPKGEQPVTLNLTHRPYKQGYLLDRASIDAWQKRRSGGELKTVPMHVDLKFAKYQVNVGLKDSVFAKK